MTSLTLIIASTILYLWAHMMLNVEEEKRNPSLNWQLFYGLFLLAGIIIFVFTLARTLWYGAY